MAQKLHGVHAVETLTVYVEQENLIKETEENCKQSNNEEPTMTRKISTLPEQGSYPRGPHKERNGHIKESKGEPTFAGCLSLYVYVSLILSAKSH